MATLNPSAFCTYILSEREEQEAKLLSPQTKMWIQNVLAESAAERLTLTLNPEHPLPFMQAEAEIQGKVGILRYILAEAAEAEELLTRTVNEGDTE